MTRLAVLICIIFGIGALTYAVTERAGRGREKLGERAVCLRNVHELSSAWRSLELRGTTSGNTGSDWCSTVTGLLVTPDRLGCPSEPEHACGYALNGAVTDHDVTGSAVPEGTVLIFESDAGWNATGGRELLPDEPRHLGGDNYGFADGHVEWLPRKKNPDGTWAREPDADWVIWEPVVREGEGEVSEAEEDP